MLSETCKSDREAEAEVSRPSESCGLGLRYLGAGVI